ncbi:ABC transporter substrate-binding protein [Roseomonas sp. NAR14]|uniref:ABC transporter substrate-binding protein n=1 Tax=Roseomonas acroporae TaxID=2937791 RepID=A0A9X1Y6Z5_9PROT|nr:ABC transporter substrate-binding protein [Roseomonas acroporae]MCK8784268.1 ABC transporter substrate-binding protein [Roseomonas acroporae]
MTGSRLATPALPSPRLARRTLLAGGGAALTIGLAAPATAQGGSLVSTVFGGVYEREYRKAIVEPFERETGIRTQLKLGSSAEWLTSSLVNRRNPEIDLLLLPYPDNIRAVLENVGLPLSAAEIPNIAEVAPVWLEQWRGQAVGLDYVSYGIAYREDLVPKPITSWKDLWDPALRGKVTLPNIGVFGSWEMIVLAARLHGGSEENLAPAFPALKALRGSVRQFFRGGTDITNMLSSGEAAVVGMTTHIPPYALIDAGKPVRYVIPEEGGMVGAVSYHIARNSRNAELCKRFINFALSRPVQEAVCNGLVAGPTNTKAVIAERTRERVPTLDRLQLFDWFKVVPQMPALTERWNREVAF